MHRSPESCAFVNHKHNTKAMHLFQEVDQSSDFFYEKATTVVPIKLGKLEVQYLFYKLKKKSLTEVF